MTTEEQMIAENIRLKAILKIIREYGFGLLTVPDTSSIIIGGALIKIASIE